MSSTGFTSLRNSIGNTNHYRSKDHLTQPWLPLWLPSIVPPQMFKGRSIEFWIVPSKVDGKNSAELASGAIDVKDPILLECELQRNEPLQIAHPRTCTSTGFISCFSLTELCSCLVVPSSLTFFTSTMTGDEDSGWNFCLFFSLRAFFCFFSVSLSLPF